MTPEMLTSVFGWMTVLNFGLLLFSTLMIFALRDWAADFHSRIMGVPKDEVINTYFSWLGSYKLLTLVFCLAPYIALRIVV